MFSSQNFTGSLGTSGQVIGPGTGLEMKIGIFLIMIESTYFSGKVMVNTWVLQLLPWPSVLHHAAELLLHVRHVAGAVHGASAAAASTKEITEQQVSFMDRLKKSFLIEFEKKDTKFTSFGL